ncbi:histidine kinase [Microbacterium rhizosphaerae]|uniref:Histidine kinase n=1 Tax=Microbacterium rhizosphaerae TaxID=1678237 RepID=A0ABZ0SRJ1_9MICO|nr:histidine kinase [Microbacterium rhizosphaerae]WPR90874.1 histidine kinase [Microbacterium rhizosphaerae]
MATTLLARAASVLVGLEALGVLGVAVWQVVAVAGGDTDSAVSSIALLVLTVVGAVAVGAFAIGIWRGWSWGRSGGIVTQLLIIAVAVGAMTGAGADPLLGIGLIIPALIVFVLLVLVIRRVGAENADDTSARS